MVDVRESFSNLGDSIRSFFEFVQGKLSNFNNLSMGEKIAYVCVFVGFLFILVSLVLFVFM